MSTGRTGEGSSATVPPLRRLTPLAVAVLVMAAALLISAGRLGWAMAWAWIGLIAVNTIVSTLGIDQELLAERSEIREGAQKGDIVLAFLLARLGPIAQLIVAGLDMRHGWSAQIPLTLQITAVAIGVLGSALTTWAMASNRFFSGVVRIQKDRGHIVATGGPYQYVRHPGYVGAILFNLATPLMLSSQWALIPAGLTVCVTIVRTALEDKTLHEELDGYKEYAGRVRYRLLPGVW